MKISTIIGARPQFIKAAVVSRALSRLPSVKEVIIHTGQHFDANMSDIFFSELDIPMPDYNLGIGGGSHGQNTGRMIEALESTLLHERPDWVLVYGDTDSTLAAALAAAKLHLPVAHVEAGLRSFNRRMPEEINRVLTDHASSLLFAPTATAVQNLKNEGIFGDRVIRCGDVMLDAALYYGERAQERSTILQKNHLAPRSYLLATIHRKENTDDPARLNSIFSALAGSKCPIILPLHPRTRKKIAEQGIQIPDKIKMIDPVGYLDMVMLEKHAQAIITDSGGVQKEAYFHSVPCITLRDETEWVELVEAGANKIVGADPALIASAIDAIAAFPVKNGVLYGDGHAGDSIATTLATTRGKP